LDGVHNMIVLPTIKTRFCGVTGMETRSLGVTTASYTITSARQNVRNKFWNRCCKCSGSFNTFRSSANSGFESGWFPCNGSKWGRSLLRESRQSSSSCSMAAGWMLCAGEHERDWNRSLAHVTSSVCRVLIAKVMAVKPNGKCWSNKKWKGLVTDGKNNSFLKVECKLLC
jgi:hypothetical protein